jgi:hypothetical protein
MAGIVHLLRSVVASSRDLQNRGRLAAERRECGEGSVSGEPDRFPREGSHELGQVEPYAGHDSPSIRALGQQARPLRGVSVISGRRAE